MIKPTKVEKLYEGFLEIQGVTMKNDEGDTKVFERCKAPTGVVGICHDPINDMVMLVEQYRVGAMRNMIEFPAGLVEDDESLTQAITREIKEETGCDIKSASLVQDYMSSPSTDYAPVYLFYCTFDSRQANHGQEFVTGPFESTTIHMMPAKQLIREVSDGVHKSSPVIMGAQYLKLLRHNLEK